MVAYELGCYKMQVLFVLIEILICRAMSILSMWVSPPGVYSFKILHNRWRFSAVEVVEYKWMHINSDFTLTARIQ